MKRAWRRCGNRLSAIFDLAKRWQRVKAARRVLGPWWNVLRAGFETLYMQYFDLARQGLRAMAKRWQGGKGAGKGLKLMVLGPWWNVLRAGFETLSKCSISTLQNNGKKGF